VLANAQRRRAFWDQRAKEKKKADERDTDEPSCRYFFLSLPGYVLDTRPRSLPELSVFEGGEERDLARLCERWASKINNASFIYTYYVSGPYGLQLKSQ